MSGSLPTSAKLRIPRSQLVARVHDERERERESLAEAVYDLLSKPMDHATLLAEVRDEWGECTEDQLGEALRRLRLAGHVRRRRDRAYARTRAA